MGERREEEKHKKKNEMMKEGGKKGMIGKYEGKQMKEKPHDRDDVRNQKEGMDCRKEKTGRTDRKM